MGLLGKDAVMTLLSYPDDGFASGEKKIELNFKPETLNVKLSNKIDNACVINSISGGANFQRGNPAALDLVFIIDTSIYNDVVSFGLGKPKKDLNSQLKELQEALYNMDGDTHEPRYLNLKWGKLRLGNGAGGGFYCRLKSMDIKYTLIGPDGIPKVAEINCSFTEDLAAKQADKLANKSSPDLTHRRMVQAGDTLAGKTSAIYRSPIYMVEVARFNGLDSLRSLTPGQQLSFPPLDS